MITPPPPYHATFVTLFPEAFPGTLGLGLCGKALSAQQWSFDTVNPRDFAPDTHKTVDDTPYGGGAGMVLKPDVLAAALESVAQGGRPCYYLSPRGHPFTQDRARKLAEKPGIVLLCGRYEGVDQRVLDSFAVEELSIGDYVLSGGESAAQVILEAILRLRPGMMGNKTSGEEESFTNGLLEYPHYTRPATWRGIPVPAVLRQGNHQDIARWRQDQQVKLTQDRRPDLWQRYLQQQDN